MQFYTLEIKGCKAYTRVIIDDDPASPDNSTFAMVLEKFKSCYSELDLEYMLDRKQEEAYFDIGVTYQPVDKNEKLVGLWRLECLKESFGAGGYLQGNLPTINTLGNYGTLQAEMESKWSE